MFKIKDSTIYCSRGDGGTITLKIPITDLNNYIKYEDISSNVYWYDTKKNKLYDFSYNESNELINTLNMVCYQFQIGDKITFNIYEKNGYNKDPLLKKEINVTSMGSSIDIPLLEKDTTFTNSINKETIFWYDITLNNNQTIVCYNEDGAKEFILYPAKGGGE